MHNMGAWRKYSTALSLWESTPLVISHNFIDGRSHFLLEHATLVSQMLTLHEGDAYER